MPTTPKAASKAAGVGETYAMVEATAHAMAEAVVAVVEATAHAMAEAVVAVVEAISTIMLGQIAVAVVGVVVSTAVGRVGH